MNIGIIGAGFTGLSAALELQKQGHTVTLFEKESIAGGLAIGFLQPDWDWSLEKHYHHIFATDHDILQLAREVDVTFNFYRPNTSSFIEGDIIQLDSPLKVLQFPKLSLFERVRMGMALAYLKSIPFNPSLEQVTAHDWLIKWMGKKAYEMLWEPLLAAKFGDYKHTISLAWFWARIKARSTQLGYPEGGFQRLADTAAEKVMRQGGIIYYNADVSSIDTTGKSTITAEINQRQQQFIFDKILVTVPNMLFAKMATGLPKDYVSQLASFNSIGAITIVLELTKPFFTSDVYWLSICDESYPFLAVVEHTNFIDKKHYHNRHIVYIGNYLPREHVYFTKTAEEIMVDYDAYLQKLNPDYKDHLANVHMFKVPFAQPIVPTNFSKHILPFQTPLKDVYLANMQQVYPWDRGTNFAVELGKKVVQEMIKSKK